MNLQGGRSWYYWPTLVAGLALVVSFIFGRRNWVWHNWLNMVAAMLSHKRCAQCAYPIGDARAADDGRVVCPECGAAWFAASIGKPMAVGSGGATVER
jgi:hypothetical protein